MNKNFKTCLKHWVGKMFKNENKSKKLLNEIARKITTCDLKESKHQLEDIIANDLYLKIQEIKAKEASFQEALALIQHFVLEHDLKGAQKLAPYISTHLQKYFSDEDNSHNSTDFIPNAVHPDQMGYDCICPKTTRDLQVSERTERCYRCQKEFHTNCLWSLEEGSRDYECPLCYLRFCLPNRRVEQVLFGGYLRQTKKDKIEYIINLPLESLTISDYVIEARCVRLNRQNRYELTWPQNCYIMLNHRKIAEFKPLPASSSLKRRVDQEVLLQRKFLTKDNIMMIEEKHHYMGGVRNYNYSHHFIAIVAVTPLSVNQTQDHYAEHKLSIQQSKVRLMEYLDRGFQDCYIQKLKIPLNCHFYTNKISIPVRSKHCRSHYEPFDLKGFIYANISSRLSAQRWKCPICKKRAYDLEIDEYLLKIINSDPHLTEIYLNRQGEVEICHEKLNDKDQPSLTTNSSAQVCADNDLCSSIQHNLGTTNRDFIKKEVKSHSNESNSCQQIPGEESSEKSKILFQECIELLDSDSEPIEQVVKPKRSYRSRALDRTFQEIPQKPLRKRNKKENFKVLEISKASLIDDSNSVQPIESQEFQNCHSDNDDEGQSPYNDEEFKTKPSKKKKGKRTYQRQKVGIEEPLKSVSKMAKTLVPSPSIRTVIPQAIQISDVKIPEPKKSSPQQQTIEIPQSDEQNVQVLRFKKLQYHLQELQRQKMSFSAKGQKWEITSQEQRIFLSMCQNFILSMHRS